MGNGRSKLGWLVALGVLHGILCVARLYGQTVGMTPPQANVHPSNLTNPTFPSERGPLVVTFPDYSSGTQPAPNAALEPWNNAAADRRWFGHPNPTDHGNINDPTDIQLAPASTELPPWRELLRPIVKLEWEWQPSGSDVGFSRADVGIVIPTYPVFGPPPPMLSTAFEYTWIEAPSSMRLPDQLYDFSFGGSWLRPLGARWKLQTLFSAALATDGEHVSRDAWQFRGGVLGIYESSPQWQWIVGAIALGRRDLPAVPAVGAIWQPSETVRLDMTLPQAKANLRWSTDGVRDQWLYLGGGFGGGTWAYEDTLLGDDVLTYRQWQVVVGWESIPHKRPGQFFVRGRKLAVEAGWMFAREIEFESVRRSIDLDDAFVLQVKLSF